MTLKPILRSVLLGAAGILLSTFSVVVYLYFPQILKAKVAQIMVLSNGTEMYERWQKIPVPVFTKITFFNVTNAEAVMKNDKVKPELEEVGPFVFKEGRYKEVTGFGVAEDGLETVSYYEYRTFEFIPEMSVGDLDTTVTIVNVPLAGIGGMIDDVVTSLAAFMRPFAKSALGGIINKYKERMFTTKTARELIFDGYKISFLDELMKKARYFKKDVKDPLPDNVFGLLYGQNYSHTGHFTVYTGKDDVTKYSRIVAWNNSRSLPYWNNKYCNMINGTDGEQFYPFINKEQTLYTFTPDLCSSVPFVYERDSSIFAIPVLRFTNPKNYFLSPEKNPDRACYCLKDTRACTLDGLSNLSPCQHGAPLYMSLPHFLEADKSLLSQMTGFQPDKDKHENFMEIEPTTGLVLKLARRIQLNIHLTPAYGVPPLEQVQERMFPFAWIEVSGAVTEDLARELKGRFQTPIMVLNILLVAALVAGGLAILWAFKVLIFDIYRKKKNIFSTPKVVYVYDSLPTKPSLPEENTFVVQDYVKTPLPPADDCDSVAKPFIYPTLPQLYTEKYDFTMASPKAEEAAANGNSYP